MNKLIAITLLALSASCAHNSSPLASRYVVDVESLSGGSATNTGHVIYVESGMSDINTTDLRFQKYSNVVHNVLQEAGYKTTSSLKAASVKIVLTYDIEKIVNESSVTVPVYKQTGVNNVYGQRVGTLSSFDSQTFDTTTVDFKRWATLRAYDVKSGENLWEVKASSVGPGNDLREVFPYLMLAAKDKIGSNSNEEVVVLEDEAKATELRKPASLSK